MPADLIVAAAVAFAIIWAAVYSGTKAALRSFFRRQYYDQPREESDEEP